MYDARMPANLRYMYDTFKEWLSEQGYLRTTVRTYDSHVLNFLRFVASRSDLHGQLPAEWPVLLDGYVSHLRMDQATVATVNNHLTAVSMFFAAHGLTVPRLPRDKRLCTMPAALGLEEQIRIKTVCDKTREKDRAVILLFLGCGLRLGELIDLNIDSVIFAPESVSLEIESRLRRRIALDEEVAEALVAWIDCRRSIVGVTGERALFVSQRGTRLNPSAIDAIVRKVGHRAGLVISATVLRDTFFAGLAKSGVDKSQMAAFSGTTRMLSRYQ